MRHNLSIQERTLKSLTFDLSHQLQQLTGSSLSTSSNFTPVTEIGLLFLSYVHRIKTRSINQLKSAVSEHSPNVMILHHANRNRKTGTQFPSVNFSSQKNNPLLKFGARTAEETEWHLARSLNFMARLTSMLRLPFPSILSQRECAPASLLL